MSAKLRTVLSLLMALAMVFSLAACNSGGEASKSNPDTDPTEVVPGLSAENYPRVDGSTANLPLLASMYSYICGVTPEEAEAKVNISGGTGAVWRNMMYDGSDLLVVYEAPENVKEDITLQSDLALEVTPVGRDGMVFLVNANNPIDSLTQQQLIDIYTGKITDWEQVGGDPGPISPFQRNEESGSQTLFMKLLMKDITPMDPPTELRQGSMGGLIDAVASFDGSGGAIGYSVYYYANLMYTNPNLKLISVDGVAPSAESISDGSYPLTNDFFVVIRENEPEGSPARLLRDWLLTEDAARLMREGDYIPVSGETIYTSRTPLAEVTPQDPVDDPVEDPQEDPGVNENPVTG